LSPSVANIKANTASSASVVIPSAVKTMPDAISDTGKKVPFLFYDLYTHTHARTHTHTHTH
jgi:hypothetical protein